jgi:hypothetical protein
LSFRGALKTIFRSGAKGSALWLQRPISRIRWPSGSAAILQGCKRKAQWLCQGQKDQEGPSSFDKRLVSAADQDEIAVFMKFICVKTAGNTVLLHAVFQEQLKLSDNAFAIGQVGRMPRWPDTRRTARQECPIKERKASENPSHGRSAIPVLQTFLLPIF